MICARCFVGASCRPRGAAYAGGTAGMLSKRLHIRQKSRRRYFHEKHNWCRVHSIVEQLPKVNNKVKNEKFFVHNFRGRLLKLCNKRVSAVRFRGIPSAGFQRTPCPAECVRRTKRSAPLRRKCPFAERRPLFGKTPPDDLDQRLRMTAGTGRPDLPPSRIKRAARPALAGKFLEKAGATPYPRETPDFIGKNDGWTSPKNRQKPPDFTEFCAGARFKQKIKSGVDFSVKLTIMKIDTVPHGADYLIE